MESVTFVSLVGFAMPAQSSLETFSAWHRTSSDAMSGRRILAVLRVVGLAALLFGALALGLWAGINWSAGWSASDRGIMDFTY
jgi:hypothetical protein